jgi:hypothetical protein
MSCIAQVWESINISIIISNAIKNPKGDVYLIIFLSILVIIRQAKMPFAIRIHNDESEQQFLYEIKDILSIAQSTKFEAKIALEGYEEYHRLNCSDPDCPFHMQNPSNAKRNEHLFICALKR